MCRKADKHRAHIGVGANSKTNSQGEDNEQER